MSVCLEEENKIEVCNCGACGSSLSNKVFESQDRAYPGDEMFRVDRCQTCGQVYLKRRPRQQYIGEFYPETDAYFDLNATVCDSDPETIKEKVVSHVFGYPVRHSSLMDGAIKLLAKTIKMILGDNVCRLSFFRIPQYVENGRLLEIGFGTGSQLLKLRARGWNVVGAELMSECCDYISRVHGIESVLVDNNSIPYPDESFDTIYLNQVFEHLYDPNAALIEYNRLLKKGGRLMITVPNYGSRLARRNGSYWRGLEVPRHLFFYDATSLRSLCVRNSFEVEILKAVNLSLVDVFQSGLPPTIENNKSVESRWWSNAGLLAMFGLILPIFGYGETLYLEARKE